MSDMLRFINSGTVTSHFTFVENESTPPSTLKKSHDMPYYRSRQHNPRTVSMSRLFGPSSSEWASTRIQNVWHQRREIFRSVCRDYVV